MGAQQVAERAEQGGRVAAQADEAMDRYAGGDDGAFEVVYDALAPELFAYLRKCNHAYAEDLVQQTFFQIHRARGAFIRGAPVKPWAFAIARRLLIDRQRRDRFELVGWREAPAHLVPRARAREARGAGLDLSVSLVAGRPGGA